MSIEQRETPRGVGFGEVARADRHIRAPAFMVCPVTCPRPYSYLKTVCERWLRYFVLFFDCLINAPAGLVRAISLNSIKISRFSSKNASEGNSEANSAYKHKSVPALGLKRFIFLRI